MFLAYRCRYKLTKTQSNVGIDYEGAGDGTDDHGGNPRSRQYNVWDEEEDF